MLRPCAVTTALVLLLTGEAVASSGGLSAPAAPKLQRGEAGTIRPTGRPSGAPAAIIIIGGIPGESRVRPGAIDASAVSAIDCSASAPAAQGTQGVISPRDPTSGLPTGKRQHRPLIITKPVDKASPLLAKAAASGTPIPNVRVEQGGVTYDLEQVLIGMVKPGTAGDRPTESLSLNFARCTRR